MIEWVRRHPFWTGIVIVGACLAFHVYQAIELVLDVMAVNRVWEEGGKATQSYPPAIASWSAPSRYEINLATGLRPPSSAENGPDLKSLVDPTNFGERISLYGEEAQIREYLALVPDRGTLEQQLVDRLSEGLASWPVMAPELELRHPLAPEPNYRIVRDSARFWCLLAWDLAHQGQPRSALLAACGPAILGAHMEIRETQVGGTTLIGLIIGAAFRTMAGQALAELAPVVKPSKNLAREVLEWIKVIERREVPFARALRSGKKLIPSVVHYLQREIENGYARQAYGREPRVLVRAFSNQSLIDFYLDPIFGEAIKAIKEPYPLAKKRLQGASEKLAALTRRANSIGWQWIGYLVRPSRLCLEWFLSISTDNPAKGYDRWIGSKAFLRGGAAAVAVHAFHEERKAWPSTISELVTWLGVEALPIDPFTNAPLAYQPGVEPRLFSPGPDLATGTADDLEFLLIPHAGLTNPNGG